MCAEEFLIQHTFFVHIVRGFSHQIDECFIKICLSYLERIYKYCCPI